MRLSTALALETNVPVARPLHLCLRLMVRLRRVRSSQDALGGYSCIPPKEPNRKNLGKSATDRKPLLAAASAGAVEGRHADALAHDPVVHRRQSPAVESRAAKAGHTGSISNKHFADLSNVAYLARVGRTRRSNMKCHWT